MTPPDIVRSGWTIETLAFHQEALRQAEEDALKSYGWVDRNNGVVRIPIDQAMKLTIQRGLPVRTEGGKKP